MKDEEDILMTSKMPIDYEKDYFDFAKYVSLYASISFEDAKMLYDIATLNGYSRDEIILDLNANGGLIHLTFRKMVDKQRI